MMALRLVPLLVAALLLNGCGLFGGDEEDNPPAELVKFKPTLKIVRAWSAGVGGDAEHLRLALQPATDGTNIYAAAHDGKVSAFEAVKGRRQWSTKTKLPLSAGPGTNGDLVVVGSSDGDVIALSAADGHALWRTRVSSEVLAAPAVTDELTVVRTVDGKLTALSNRDGAQAWFAQQSVPRLSLRGTGAPVVSGNAVLAGFDNGKIAAYDISDGTALWEVLLSPPSGRTEVDRLVDIDATLHVVGSDLYAAGYAKAVAAMAVESGQILWIREISSFSGIATDIVNLYVSNSHSEIVALSRRTGREIWRQSALLNRDITGPAAWRNSVIVGDFEGYLHWFDATTAELQARVKAGSDRITSPPLVLNDMVYVLNDGGKLFAFKARDKKRDKK